VTKPRAGRELTAICALWSHAFGWELRLEVNGLLSRSQVCRSRDEVLAVCEQWQARCSKMGGILERVRRPPLKRPFSDADLLAYWDEHVWYEVWMFFEMVSALSTPTARPSWNPTTTLPTSASTTAPTVVFSNPSLGSR
jgi:hypothetical protein